MSYERLSPKQRQVVDAIMDGHCSINQLAKHFKVHVRDIKARLTYIYLKYQIDSKEFESKVRLAYLRARELGLIR